MRVIITLQILFLLTQKICSQNEAKKWYFGANAGLDFAANPPTVLVNSAMNVLEGCASIADAAGNLLFYTNGLEVYNNEHQVMPNGDDLNPGKFANSSERVGYSQHGGAIILP